MNFPPSDGRKEESILSPSSPSKKLILPPWLFVDVGVAAGVVVVVVLFLFVVLFLVSVYCLIVCVSGLASC